jgi:4,4'-diaponeurosporenoate glycosyltransferase
MLILIDALCLVVLAAIDVAWLMRLIESPPPGQDPLRSSPKGVWSNERQGEAVFDSKEAVPRVDIVIPAKDEVANIGELLETLMSQTGVDAAIYVVDDGSTDGTAAIADRPGVTVIRLTDLADGWTGKNQACHAGAQAGSRPVLLFLDADTRLDNGGLRRIVDAHSALGGLVSFLPYYRTTKLWEGAALLFNLIAFETIRANRQICPNLQIRPDRQICQDRQDSPDSRGRFAARLNTAGKNRAEVKAIKGNAVGAFGPCLIASRADYLASGGHAAIRSASVDDLALADRMSHLGLPLSCYPGRGIVSYRMYRTGRAMWRGFTKNLFSGLKYSRPMAAALSILWVLALSQSCFSLCYARSAVELAASVAFYACGAASARLLLSRVGRVPPGAALLYPLALVYFFAVFCVSTFKTLVLRRASWKGRMVRL